VSTGVVFRVQQERDVRAKGGRVDCAKTVRAVFFFFLLGPIAAVAEDAAQPAPEYPKFGLLRERDLTPFGFLRLDMRPAHAVWIPPDTWAVEVLLGYQNTWAMSSNVEKYLQSLPGRRRLGPAPCPAKPISSISSSDCSTWAFIGG
jgi:hypothetical protein